MGSKKRKERKKEGKKENEENKGKKEKEDEEEAVCSIVSYTIGNPKDIKVMKSYLKACYDVDIQYEDIQYEDHVEKKACKIVVAGDLNNIKVEKCLDNAEQ